MVVVLVEPSWQGGPEAAKAEAGMAPVLDWLGRTLPESGAAALLHNDYRLDNCLLGTADPTRIVAVMDWDMCTQGDPLNLTREAFTLV